LSPRAARLASFALLLGACSRVSEVLTPIPDRLDAGTGGALDATAPDAEPDATAPDAAPDAPLGEPGMLTTSSVDVGFAHSCATLRGVLYCWGDNARGQLGVGDNSARTLPTRVGALTDWEQAAAGSAHSCARRSDGSVYCFGANDIGQLGLAGSEQRLVPATVALPDAVSAIVSEVNHVCAIAINGALVCWGENLEGEIGQGDGPPFISQFAPTAVGTERDWTAVDTGQGDTCGLRGGGQLYCWGRNTSSQLGLGDGGPEQTRTPTRVGDATYSRIHAGQDHTCGIRTDGSLDCWGLNTYGFLGLGDRAARTSPTQVGSKRDWLEISLAVFHTCAVDAAQHLYCWGRNVEGQLGLGDTEDRLSPTLVAGEGFVQVAVGQFHTCALKADDSVWCTGADDSGQLGLGDTERRNSFSRVTFP